MRVSIILGTRPQIIKSAPVYTAFQEAGVVCDIVNTGQHYDYEMNRQFFVELKLPEPTADLSVGPGSPASQVSAIISGLGGLFEQSKPDIVVVPGDTNSALAAGIACSKSGVPVAHLESGCRSGDFRMSEEVNRRLLDHLSPLLLCPTSRCVRNVQSEHVPARGVYNVGDTMYDSLLKLLPKVKATPPASKYGLSRGAYAFMTLHRAETVDDAGALRETLRAVGALPVPVAFSVHPRTKARIKEFKISPSPNVELFEPLPYLETLRMVEGAGVVITDSGGLQKEAYWLGRPSLIVRDTTEWREIVEAGGAFLVGTDPDRFRAAYRRALGVGKRPFAMSRRIFGDGTASAKVVKCVSSFFQSSGRERN